MRSENLLPDCDAVRPELPALLYQELDLDERAALERHLERCASCREELDALRETRECLSRWPAPALDEDPRAIAREIRLRAGGARRAPPVAAARGRRAPLVHLSAILSGAAAALLFVLCLLGTEASYAGGRLQVSFALPGSPPESSGPVSGAELESRLRAIAAQEVASHAATLEQDQQALFDRLVQMNQGEFLRLSQAVDLARAADQRAWGTRFDALTREDARTRAALVDLATYVVPVSSK